MKRIIEQDLAQAILNYLQTKPYVEVYQLVNALINLPALGEPNKENDPLASAAKKNGKPATEQARA